LRHRIDEVNIIRGPDRVWSLEALDLDRQSA
jgi:hypothetical protein